MPALKKIGAAALAAFGWTSGGGVTTVSASYLQVAGGGGGGQGNGGGGGAGGYLTGTTSLTTTLSYTVVVGAGGTGGAVGTNGSNSQFGSLTASVGGGGGGGGGSNGLNGGSGGGAGNNSTAGSGTSGQGNAGGAGTQAASYYPGGGGGGAGAVGGASPNGNTAGNGGAGSASSISGTSVTYAGGGGGGASVGGTQGTGGSGGGGAGSATSGSGGAGTANLGGGGGGGGGQGGSGIVIISYAGAQQFGGGVVTSVGGNTIHTFTTSGTLSPLASLSASYLIVAGGASGGVQEGGGGGAGGLLSGSGVTIDTASTYLVTVGAGGAAVPQQGVNLGTQGNNGSNSAFSMVSTAAVGGGGGGYGAGSGSGTNVGKTGGSGGGGAIGGAGGTGTSLQGNTGGTSSATGPNYGGGGGGGASAVGSNGTTTAGGAGGAGTASSISGTSVTYAGGGGGGTAVGGSGGAGGSGGGGAGSATTAAATSGTANTGGGGGGGFNDGATNYASGAGGSGIVIIAYAGSTQQMAGGSVTITGGNVIHTFTSSGYLTPLTYYSNSLRFRSSASAYLSRTLGTATSTQKFTMSAWVKRGILGTSNQTILASTVASGSQTNSLATLYFDSSDNLHYTEYTSGSITTQLVSSAVYRDPAAWYHVVLTIDSTQATAANRAILYVNGSQITSLSTATYPSQNASSTFNIAGQYAGIGGNWNGSAYTNFLDGYQTNTRFIDGQALTPNSFGTFNSYGVWQPINYGGSYGTNGFYLPFKNGSSSYAGSFNGSTQTLSLASNSAFAFGTGDYTVEMWLNSTSTGNQVPYGSGGTGTNNFYISYNPGGSLFSVGTQSVYVLQGSVALSANAWYHVAASRSNGTLRLFVNGIQIASGTDSTNWIQGGNPTIGNNAQGSQYYSGLISNVQIVKGTAVYTSNFIPSTTPLTAIANTQLLTLQNATFIDNSTNAFTITNNGSMANPAINNIVFANPVSLTADQSPQGNNWTANNISTTAGSTYDSMTDVPTLTSATAANYCTLNPLQFTPALSNANLNVLYGSQTAAGTIGVTSGKWYYEAYVVSQNTYNIGVGVMNQNHTASYLGGDAYSWAIWPQSDASNGLVAYNGATSSSGVTFAPGDTVLVAFDVDSSKIWFGKNGTWVLSGNPAAGTNPVFSSLSGTIFPACSNRVNTGGEMAFNFGQRPFTYTPPSGYVALNTYNL